MVKTAADWPWSSYRAVVGVAGPPEWLQTDSILAHFGRSRRKAIIGFVDFVRAGVEQPGLWPTLQGQVFLGSKTFIEEVQQWGDDQSTRQGWEEKFQCMASAGDDNLLDDERNRQTTWDENEWQW